MMNSAPKLSSAPDVKVLFKDLGRPTLRGVRKCPNCGVYNGIRGLSCKNKDCNIVLRGKGRKGNQSADAIRIITGSSAMIYSVRLRDKGPDYRGFVELPLSGEIILQGPDSETMTLVDVPHCFIGSCQKAMAADGSDTTTCPHIDLAQKCTTEAQPLTLKNSVLNSLPVSNEMKQSIWLLATETTGPLVQRVSKNIMVVKCKAHAPSLGFLHFSFSESPRKKGSVEHRFHCSCRQFKNFKHSSSNEKKCVHFYACICAFASDDDLAKEFKYFINMDDPEKEDEPVPSPSNSVQITIIDGQVSSTSPETVSMAITMPPLQSKKRRKDDTLAQASSALLTLQEGAASPAKKALSRRGGGAPAQDPDHSFNKGVTQLPVEAPEGPTVSFNHWLGSVTERINQTMHYQFEGSPEPLVFHIPQVFFDILQQRISSGSRKKRLPNSTVAFIRKDALPLGTFTKYTWQLTSIIQVKQIFDTPDMPLEVTRSFVENKDGTFSRYVSPKVDVEHVGEAFRRAAGQIPIKPFELKTFLKIGNTAADQKEPTPFIIEWIPDILPKSRIGELRIKFEYGHQRNGHVERRMDELQTAIEHVV